MCTALEPKRVGAHVAHVFLGGRMAKKGRYYLLALLVGSFVWTGYKHYKRVMVRDPRITVYASDVLALDYKQALAAYVSAIKSCDPAVIIKNVQAKFPLAERVRVSRQAGSCSVFFDVASIKCVFNNSYVLDIRGRAYAIKTISVQEREKLAHIYAPDERILRDERFQAFVRAVPENLLRTYHVFWRGPYDIELTSPGTPYTIRARYDRMPDEELLCAVQRAFEHAQSINKKKKFNEIDVRFDHRVIVRMHTGG